MCENHELALPDGSWTESFHPAEYVDIGVESDQRDKLLQISPELKSANGIKKYGSVRRALKSFETETLHSEL